MHTEQEITRSAQTPTGTKYYRDQETRDIVEGHSTTIAGLSDDMDDIKTALNYPEGSITWFGWKKPVGDAQSEGIPCGNLLRLARMKNILKLGGYMVKNNHTRRKLAANDHRYYEDDGSAVVFTGADGHYQWGWGVDLYYAAWTEGGYDYEAFDDRPIYGHPCVMIPIGSVSASGRAALDNTNLILCGYLSDAAQFRGGNNNAEWDNTYRSLLGMPATLHPVDEFSAYARKNGSMWMASERVSIFIVGALMRVFFHNSNIQAAFEPSLDENGLHHGGLGMGVDCESGSWWNSYNSYYPYFKMSLGIEKGDFTGLISETIELSDGTTKLIENIPCFMGLKNWYKSLAVITEDELLVNNANGKQDHYVKKVIDGTAPARDSVTGYTLAGSTPVHASASWSYIKQINKQYLSATPTQDEGTADTFYGDGYYNPNSRDGALRAAYRLGHAHNGDYAGSCCLNGNNAPADSDASIGAVLCEFTESFDSELTLLTPADEEE